MRFCIIFILSWNIISATPQTWNIMNDILDQQMRFPNLYSTKIQFKKEGFNFIERLIS